jgi:hypothetical protein
MRASSTNGMLKLFVRIGFLLIILYVVTVNVLNGTIPMVVGPAIFAFVFIVEQMTDWYFIEYDEPNVQKR